MTPKVENILSGLPILAFMAAQVAALMRQPAMSRAALPPWQMQTANSCTACAASCCATSQSSCLKLLLTPCPFSDKWSDDFRWAPAVSFLCSKAALIRIRLVLSSTTLAQSLDQLLTAKVGCHAISRDLQVIDNLEARCSSHANQGQFVWDCSSWGALLLQKSSVQLVCGNVGLGGQAV